MIGIFCIVVLACLVGMAACPLVAYVIARRKYRSRVAASRKTVLIYYAIVALSFTMAVTTAMPPPPSSQPFAYPMWDMLTFLAVIALFVPPLAGPFVAAGILRAAKGLSLQARMCVTCGYNLTGNTSGVCPECGTPIDAPRTHDLLLGPSLMSVPWRRLLPAWLAVVILITGLVGYLGYVNTHDDWFCSECAIEEFRGAHEFRLPWDGPLLFEIPAGINRDHGGRSPLTRLLDPQGQCRHNWIGNGGGGDGVTTAYRGSGQVRTASSITNGPEFAQYVREHPNVLDRIRSSLRQSVSVTDWLPDEYYAWKESQEPIDSTN